MRLLGGFLRSLFPERPWFERESIAHANALVSRPAPAGSALSGALYKWASGLLGGAEAAATAAPPRCLDPDGLPTGFEMRSQLLSPAELDEARTQIERLAAGPDDGVTAWRYYEFANASELNRIERFVPDSAFFAELSRELLRRVCGDELASTYTLFKDKINMKPPQGEAFKAHQDISAGWGAYAERHMTIALPLHDSSVGSGGLFLADSPGRALAAGRVDLTEAHLAESAYHPVATSAGDAIVFDSLTPHYSLPNREGARRPIIYFTYTRGPSRYDDYFADKLEAVPPDALKVPCRAYRSGNTHVLRRWTAPAAASASCDPASEQSAGGESSVIGNR